MVPGQKLLFNPCVFFFNNALHQNAVLTSLPLIPLREAIWQYCQGRPNGSGHCPSQHNPPPLPGVASVLTHTCAFSQGCDDSAVFSKVEIPVSAWFGGGGGIDDDKDKPRNPIPNLTTMQRRIFFFFFYIRFLPTHFKFLFLQHNNYIYYYKLFARALQYVQGLVYWLHSKQFSKEMPLSLFYRGSVTSHYAA